MTKRHSISFISFVAAVSLFACPGQAQNAAPSDDNPGRKLVAGACFQCHTDTMFRDQRQDRKSWEATIYRMMGRGGLWTADERKVMADYLATDYGPQVKPVWEQATSPAAPRPAANPERAPE